MLTHTHDVLRERLLNAKGIFLPTKTITLAELERKVNEIWSHQFITYMRNRLKMGQLRYGPPRKRDDFVPRMRAKLDAYEKTGNSEMLVDIGNYCMLEFRFNADNFVALDDQFHH